MAVLPKEFLSSAIELLAYQDAKEIDFRNAISRAYYCCYNLSIDKFGSLITPDNPEQTTNLGVHAKLIRAIISNHSTATIGNDLRILKHRRKRADYDLDEFVTERQAQQAIDEAKLIVEKIEESDPVISLVGQPSNLAS